MTGGAGGNTAKRRSSQQNAKQKPVEPALLYTPGQRRVVLQRAVCSRLRFGPQGLMINMNLI
jgi:hypothetical protein